MPEQNCVFVIVESCPPLAWEKTANSLPYTRVALHGFESFLPSNAGETGKISRICAKEDSTDCEILQSLASSFLTKFSDGVVGYFEHGYNTAPKNLTDWPLLKSNRFALCWCPDAEKLSGKLEKMFIRIKGTPEMTPFLIIIAKEDLVESEMGG